jgi:hypothetical protein
MLYSEKNFIIFPLTWLCATTRIKFNPSEIPIFSFGVNLMRVVACCFLVLAFPLLIGCRGGAKAVKVSGRVTMDGQPLSKARVIFQSQGPDGKPDPNKEAGGETDSSGNYSLKRAKDQADGTTPGEYRIEIHAIERSTAVQQGQQTQRHGASRRHQERRFRSEKQIKPSSRLAGLP